MENSGYDMKKDRSDRIIFVLLASVFLTVAIFLTSHLIDVFLLPVMVFLILTSVYIAILIIAYKIYLLSIKKHQIIMSCLRELMISDYKGCEFCGKPLSIKDFYYSNKKLSLQELVSLWNNTFYGLLCCECFQNTSDNFWIKIKHSK